MADPPAAVLKPGIPDPMFYDKKGKVLPEIVTKMTRAMRNVTIPEWCYGFHHRYIPLEKERYLGLLMKRDTVHSVQANGSFQGYLQPGDVITHVDKQLVDSDHVTIFNMITSRIPSKLHISLARLKCRVNNLPDPAKYLPEAGFSLEYKMLYMMRGMKVGLQTYDLDGRCFVTGILPDSVASMALTVGDRIREVDTTTIDNTAACAAALMERFKKGYVRVCVEIPNNDAMKTWMRMRLLATPAARNPLNVQMPRETRAMVEVGIKALTNLKAEPKSIYKETSILKEKQRTNPHIVFDNVVNWYGVVSESVSRFIVKVPPLKSKQEMEGEQQPEKTAEQSASTATDHSATDQDAKSAQLKEKSPKGRKSIYNNPKHKKAK